MSDIPGAWFHCCHCGALFKAVADPGARGDCPDCGHDPATGEEAEAAGQTLVRVRHKVRKSPGHHHGKKHRSREGKRKARALMIFVVGWICVVGCAAFFLKRLWPDAAPKPSAEYVAKERQLSQEDSKLLQDHTKECSDRLVGFYSASDPAARSLHALASKETLGRMVRYYAANPGVTTPVNLRLRSQNVLHTPAGPAIELLWTGEDDVIVEGVFFEERGEWKLDWDAFVRAGSEPWGLFLAGQGSGQGNFRVLARERIGAGGRADEGLGLVLYFPRPGHPGEASTPSPEIRVKRASPLGRALEEAFAARKESADAFGGIAFTQDPADMIRLHVRLRREGEAERVFDIMELLATHWLEIPGTPIKAE